MLDDTEIPTVENIYSYSMTARSLLYLLIYVSTYHKFLPRSICTTYCNDILTLFVRHIVIKGSL